MRRARATAILRGHSVALALVCACALGACSSSGNDATPAASQGTPGDATTSVPASTGQSSDPTQSGTPPVARVPRKQLELDQVRLEGGGGPDWMGVGFGSLWVKRDNNVVDRIAPDGRILATFQAGSFVQPVCQGIGVGEKAVWACANGGKIMRIDPRTNQIAAVVDVPKVNEQGRLTYYDGRIWLLTGDGDELVGLSESDNKLGDPIDLGAYCTDVSDRVVASTLWVACPYDDSVLRVDLEAGEVTARVGRLRGAVGVTAGDDVWVCVDQGIAHVDADSLTVVGTQPLASGVSCSLRLYGDTLWVRTGYKTSPFVARIDASSGQLVETVTSEGRISGGDVIEFKGALWVSSYEEGAVYKLRRPGL